MRRFISLDIKYLPDIIPFEESFDRIVLGIKIE